MKTHCSIIFQPIFWSVIKELYWLLQKWSLKNDMLQQGELRVVGCEKEDPTWVHLDSKEGWVEWKYLCIEGAIKIAYRKIEMFHLPSHSIAFFALLDVSKFTNPQLAAKRSVYLSWLSRWLTKRVIILHASSSKVVEKVWMLALTLASPSACPMILHSKGRITYRPSFSEILGAQIMLLTWTSPLIAIAMQKSTSIAYPILWRRQIQLCLNTVRKVECHLSQESSPIVAMASHFGQNT